MLVVMPEFYFEEVVLVVAFATFWLEFVLAVLAVRGLGLVLVLGFVLGFVTELVLVLVDVSELD